MESLMCGIQFTSSTHEHQDASGFHEQLTLIIGGGSRIDLEALTALPPAGFEQDGGFGNAIVGTQLMVGIASLTTFQPGPSTTRFR